MQLHVHIHIHDKERQGVLKIWSISIIFAFTASVVPVGSLFGWLVPSYCKYVWISSFLGLQNVAPLLNVNKNTVIRKASSIKVLKTSMHSGHYHLYESDYQHDLGKHLMFCKAPSCFCHGGEESTTVQIDCFHLFKQRCMHCQERWRWPWKKPGKLYSSLASGNEKIRLGRYAGA